MLAALTRDLLPITGSRPLAGWDVVGTVRRVPSPGGTGGFVMEMKEGSPPSRIEISGLRSRHRYVALEVHTRPGKPFAIEVGVPAPHHALKVTSPWLPQRSFTLSLHARDPATGERLAVGAAATCTVTILTHREWPVEGAATMPPRALFWAYVREVVRDNFSREAYWFAGMVFRALHASFIHPLLLLLFLDNLGSRQFFDGLLLATIKAFCLLQDHYSAQWFSVQASAAITDRRTRQPLRVVIRHCV